MRINVAQLLKEPIGSSRTYQIEESLDTGDVSSVKGEVKLVRTDRGIMVSGVMSANVKGICSRCLKAIDYQVKYDFAEESLPNTGISECLASSDQPCYIAIDDSQEIDLSEVVYQYALLSIPAKPLCGQECAGICPNCGLDLNQGTCRCSSEAYDERWSKLIRLGKER